VAQLFISDLHLSPARPGIAKLFLGFLKGPARDGDVLYILGDLFEYWAGDDDLADPFNRDIGEALAECTASGTRVSFMRGNRDFLIGRAFAINCGIELIEDPFAATLDDRTVMLSHGDELCTDDAAYLAFRSQVRSTSWAEAFLARPLIERKNEIEALRVRSEREKRSKPAAIMDVNEAAVSGFFRRHDCDRLIHGHTHRPGVHVYQLDGRRRERWVLADWYDQGSYLLCERSGLRALPWKGT